MPMINDIRVIGLSESRSGSSYIFDNITKYIKLIRMRNKTDHRVFYLGECFNPKHSKGIYDITEDNWLSVKKSTDFNIDAPSWHDQQKMTREILHILETVKNPIVAKVFPSHLRFVNQSKFWRFLNDGHQMKIFLYRNDLEDRVLSNIFAQKSGVWKAGDNVEYVSSNMEYNSKEDYQWITGGIESQANLFNCYDHVEWDHVIKYESLSGDPMYDLVPLFPDVDLTLLSPPHTPYKKLLSKQEKINMLGEESYNHFYKDFINQCNHFNVDPYATPS
jgi:hypothetical protein